MRRKSSFTPCNNLTYINHALHSFCFNNLKVREIVLAIKRDMPVKPSFIDYNVKKWRERTGTVGAKSFFSEVCWWIKKGWGLYVTRAPIQTNFSVLATGNWKKRCKFVKRYKGNEPCTYIGVIKLLGLLPRHTNRLDYFAYHCIGSVAVA